VADLSLTELVATPFHADVMVSDLRSLQARRIIAEAVRKAFMEHRLDALVTPTLSATAVLKDQQDIQYESEAEAGPCRMFGPPLPSTSRTNQQSRFRSVSTTTSLRLGSRAPRLHMTRLCS